MKPGSFRPEVRHGSRLQRLKARCWFVLSLVLVLQAFAGVMPSTQAAPLPPDPAQSIAPAAQQQIKALLDEKAARTPAQRKIDSELLYTIKTARGEQLAIDTSSIRAAVAVAADGMAELDLRATVSKRLLVQLTALGATVEQSNAAFHSIQVRAPLLAIEGIAALKDVVYIQTRQQGQLSNTGTPSAARAPRPGFDERAARVRQQLAAALTRNVSEGDVTHRADKVRTNYSITGRGITVGVLSDGVDSLASLQASGDLPPNVRVLPGQAGSGDEGSAMLEIVHDLAPEAQLIFASATSSIEQFAQNILDLRAAGSDILVDDIYFFAETPFQLGQAPGVVSPNNSGIVTQAVNQITASGALYFSAALNAGNQNDKTSGVWEGDFADGGPVAAPLPGLGSVHDFDSSGAVVVYDSVTQTSFSASTTLFWSDPLGGSGNDYDLFVLNASGTVVLDASTNIQNGTQDPFEKVNPQASGNRLVIVKRPGAAQRFLHLNTNRGRLQFSTAGQTHGHVAAPDAFTVAATPAHTAFGDAPNPVGPFPSPFNASNTVELFSSDGPRRYFFNADGSPITPGNLLSTGGLVVPKPDITAADGVSCNARGFSTFFGTSAAAPHAAAIAALIKSIDLALTPAQIRSLLTSTAIDIEQPGVDRDSGAGIIDAFAAAQAAGATPRANLALGGVQAVPAAGDGDASIEPGETATLSISLNNIGAVAATAVSATLTTATPGVVVLTNSASYQAIGVNATQANTTPFTFGLATTADCGQRIDFTLTVAFTGGVRPQQFNFAVSTGQPGTTPTTISYAGPAVDIPDNSPAGVNIPLVVSGLAGNVSDINFSIDGTNCSTTANSTTVGVAHTWVGDLTFTLTSPSGKAITLIERIPGGSGSSGGHNFCQTLLDDQDTTTPIEMSDAPGAPYTGRFLPSQPLAAFNGTPANGTWTLNVADSGAGDTGTVRAFSLIISTYEPCNAAGPHAIAATGGAAQQAGISATFGKQLQATVTTVGGLPIAGVAVTFTAPADGAGGTFPDGNLATTDANGRAEVRFRANGQLGSYRVTANTTPPMATAATFALTNTAPAPIYLPLVLKASR